MQHSLMAITNCDSCGAIITRRIKLINQSPHHFCNRNCCGNWRSGMPRSEETKQRIADAHKGNSLSAETKQKIANSLKGRRHSAERRRKLSEALKGKYMGPRNHRWKGGEFPYGPFWRTQRKRVRARDNYTCQLCGITEEELEHRLSVHHIRPFRESGDNTMENLICLCGKHNQSGDQKGRGCHRICEDEPIFCPEPRKHWLLTAFVPNFTSSR